MFVRGACAASVSHACPGARAGRMRFWSGAWTRARVRPCRSESRDERVGRARAGLGRRRGAQGLGPQRVSSGRAASPRRGLLGPSAASIPRRGRGVPGLAGAGRGVGTAQGSSEGCGIGRRGTVSACSPGERRDARFTRVHSTVQKVDGRLGGTSESFASLQAGDRRALSTRRWAWIDAQGGSFTFSELW